MRERLKERASFSQAAIEARLAQKRLESRKPETVIQAIFDGELRDTDVSQAYLVELCGAAADHPALLTLPESSYLKCAFVRVD